MRYNKFKAFTIAEVMILLLTLSILMAAFAPVFTRRYNNASSDKVWSYVAGDTQYDAYMDAVNKSFSNTAFIGLTPVNSSDVLRMTEGINDIPIPSKVVIAASNAVRVNGLSSPQNQMQFRYSNSAVGTPVASLFAGNGNMLVGGPYKAITNSAEGNTSFGVGSLEAISTGDANVALGRNAGNNMATGNANVFVGTGAAEKITEGDGNTIIGINALKESTQKLEYNTVIGNNSAQQLKSNANTIVGNYVMSDNEVTNAVGNTLVGSNAMKKAQTGSYNTSVGYNALASLSSGSYNTALGDNSCLNVAEGSNKTCIGSFSGSELPEKKHSHPSGLFSGDDERVFIGTMPQNAVSKSNYPGAVLEVHNINKKLDGSDLAYGSVPVSYAGASSVVVHGNLIVRGNSYFEAPIVRDSVVWDPGDPSTKVYTNLRARKGLMLFKTSNVSGKIYALHGNDGTDRNGSSYEYCHGCRRHAFENIRTDCICTSVINDVSSTYNTTYDALNASSAISRAKSHPVSTSYDWNSKANNNNGYTNCDGERPAWYTDKSVNSKVTLEYRNESSAMKKGINNPLAHTVDPQYACCPNISSDRRLKNVGEPFTAGLDEINKLKVYNFTFKNDVNKLPQVGVIAQDLKLVFPNAVVTDKDGYYKIRWDEMFYAAINSIKTLNAKIESVIAKIANQKSRVATLKRDNAELVSKLNTLSDELDKLEEND